MSNSHAGQLSGAGKTALVLSLVGIALLLAGLYCILDGRPAGVSAASLAIGAAILVLTGRYLVHDIDQPSTPSAPRAIRCTCSSCPS